MKFKNLIFILFVFSSLFIGCNDDDTEIVGNWVLKAYFGGYPRSEAVSFSINGTGYYGLGKDNDAYMKDFWKYDPTTNTWTQISNFPGTARAYNVYANTDTKGYMGLGYDGNSDLADFWEYNPSGDTWTQLIDFPAGTRRHATAFAIGNDVYVGTGSQDNNKVDMNDFWKYSNGQWTSVAGLSGQKRRESTAVALNGKGYLISGVTRSGVVLNDFWSYDPASNTWSELDKLTNEETGDTDGGIQRYNAVSFVVDGKVYVATGFKSTALSTVWEWNPTSKSWIQRTSFEGDARQGANVFVLNSSAYIVGGYYGAYFDDLRLFQPVTAKDTND